ncbi:hypothetical protein [uncultured Microbulbifer sp.]|uniref:hypothetical protein n=1 Tax=uncultured Microbulbifer sp. TaxID=348147 RepID=UPI002613B47D|nr:hypothetical protein [uncultured Microbulbifer sp.]
MINDLLELPVYIQVLLATGYIGHSVANQGFRDGEHKDELLHSILIYGMVGLMVFYSMLSFWSGSLVVSALVAISASWIFGVLENYRAQMVL